jgi:hypothetical protein
MHTFISAYIKSKVGNTTGKPVTYLVMDVTIVTIFVSIIKRVIDYIIKDHHKGMNCSDASILAAKAFHPDKHFARG